MNSRPAEGQNHPAVRVRLDLSRHCVQTACRRRYNQMVNAYFANPGQGEAEADAIEMLRQALETVDFGSLRQTHLPLCGGFTGEVVLENAGQGFVIRFDDQSVPCPCRN